MNETCCKLLGPRSKSPFDIIALGWYDGITAGVARCRTCKLAYQFELVARDDDLATRVYGLRQILDSSYDELATLHSQRVSPTEAAQHADRLALLTRDAVAGSFQCQLFIASQDLRSEINAARRVDFAFWRDALGLPGTLQP